jgi:hypothetical protein
MTAQRSSVHLPGCLVAPDNAIRGHQKLARMDWRYSRCHVRREALDRDRLVPARWEALETYKYIRMPRHIEMTQTLVDRAAIS